MGLLLTIDKHRVRETRILIKTILSFFQLPTMTNRVLHKHRILLPKIRSVTVISHDFCVCFICTALLSWTNIRWQFLGCLLRLTNKSYQDTVLITRISMLNNLINNTKNVKLIHLVMIRLRFEPKLSLIFQPDLNIKSEGATKRSLHSSLSVWNCKNQLQYTKIYLYNHQKLSSY